LLTLFFRAKHYPKQFANNVLVVYGWLVKAKTVEWKEDKWKGGKVEGWNYLAGRVA
jgi:hypothetical protein